MKKTSSILAAALLAAALAGPAAAEGQGGAPLTASAVETPQAKAARAFDQVRSAKPEDFSKLKSEEARPSEFDPKTNPRVYEISRQLRCLVCANETIADSNAELAVDLRREVARQVKTGKTDEEIVDFMVERYGDFVLFKPPFKAKTYLLWLGPAVFFLIALWSMIRIGRTRRALVEARRREATPEAVERARAILKGELVLREGRFVPPTEGGAA